jgi:uroporphyrinogen-III decarboxylase
MQDELARRKQLYRRLWAGEPLEQVPLDVRLVPKARHSVREQFLCAQKQLEVALEAAMATWKEVPSSDAIPAMRPDVGCSCLASAFGMEYYWGESDQQTPWVRSPLIGDLQEELPAIKKPDPEKDGWLPEGIKRIRMFAEAGEGFIPVSLLDAAGGLNVAADLLGVSELLVCMRTMPDEVHALLDIIEELFAELIRAGIRAAGGEENITTTDFPDTWFPENFKGHVSDDICAMIGPEMYLEFSAPYHARIFKEFGAGGLHNCGPNPCHSVYLAHKYSPRAIDLSDRYSHADLQNLKRSFKKKAFVYLLWDSGIEPVQWYRNIMETMAPDLIVIPIIPLPPESNPEEICKKLKPIAKEYAMRMDWGWQ